MNVAPPVRADAFEEMMRPLGPFRADRRIAVAVSGGPDSLCLALLAKGWGAPTALVIDHGIRAESAGEAQVTIARLERLGIPVRFMALTGVRPSGAGARAARYKALATLAHGAGCADLLLGHHAGDQAETVLMRRGAGSGASGRAGMAAIAYRHGLRLLRPLLGVAPARLRATLNHAGINWVEDPSNRDIRYLRARLRREMGGALTCRALCAEAANAGRARMRAEQAAAAYLARHADIRPEGFAVLDTAPIDAAALAVLLRMLGGHDYAPPADAVARLAADPGPGLLAGVRLMPAGRLGAGWLLCREEAAMAPPVPLHPGALWDGRFRALTAPDEDGLLIGALGAEAAAFRRRTPWPASVLRTLPAIRRGDLLCAVPALGFAAPGFAELRIAFTPAQPAAPAPFEPAGLDDARA